MCEMFHVGINVRGMRGADGSRRLARDSFSVWFSTLVLLRPKQSVVVDCLQIAKRLRQTQHQSAISTRFMSACDVKEMLAGIFPLVN